MIKPVTRLTFIHSAEAGLHRLGHKVENRDVEKTLIELQARAAFTDNVVRLWACKNCPHIFMLHKTPSSEYVTYHIERFYTTVVFTVKSNHNYSRKFMLEKQYFICDRLKNLI